MTIFIWEWLWHGNDHTILNLQIGHYSERLRVNDHQTWHNGFRCLWARYPRDSWGRLWHNKRVEPLDSRNNGSYLLNQWRGRPCDHRQCKNWGANPSVVGGTCLFHKSDYLGSTSVHTISLMTTKEEGVEATWPRRFSKYSFQSFLDPTDIALQLVPDSVIGGQKLVAIQSPFCTISLSIQVISHSTRLCTYSQSTLQSNRAWLSLLSQNEQIPQSNPEVPTPLRSRWLS